MSDRVSQAEFARIAKVHRGTVNRWIKSGRITTDADGRIDVRRALRERDASESPMPHHQARKAQFDEAKAGASSAAGENAAHAPAQAATQPAEPAPAVEKISTALKLETYKLQKAKAERAAIEVDQLAGALVDRAEIDFVLTDFGNTLRALIEGIPDRLTGPIAAHRGDSNAIHKTLEDSAHDLLAEMADHMQRRIEVFGK